MRVPLLSKGIRLFEDRYVLLLPCTGLYRPILTRIALLEDAEDAAEHSWPTITAEMLEKASTRELELTRTWINKELDDRLGLSSAPPSANKRRRLQ